MKVIKDFLGNELKYECMGCAISNLKISIPGGIIYNGKYAILAADPEIPLPGFLVVNSKRHVNSFSKLTKEEIIEIGLLIKYAEEALKDLRITTEVTLVQEERSKHLHLWIFPTQQWMIDKYGKGIFYLKEIIDDVMHNHNESDVQDVMETTQKIKQYFIEKKVKNAIEN